MFLAVRDGFVAERSDNLESLLTLDQETYDVFEWNKPLPVWNPELGEERPLDPRTSFQKSQDAHKCYQQHRLREYPSVVKQFDMLYWDAVNGTTTWVDEITRIKELYPKPAEV